MTRAQLICVAMLIAVFTASAGAGTPGDNRRTVPNLVGKSREEATAMVKAAGFENELEIDGPSMDCGDPPANLEDRHILCQMPEAGKVVDKNTYVYVVTYHKIKRDGVILHEQLESLLGLTVEKAKAKLKEFGFVGALEIATLPEYVEKCGLDKVCGHEPISAVSIRDKLRLFINPKVEISAPP